MSNSVLIVDDLQEVRVLMEDILYQTLDVKITHASTGMEAIELIEQQSFDLILMDIKMPVLDGIQAAQIIKEKDLAPNSALVFITANKNEIEELNDVFSVGAVDYISKPFETSHFVRLIKVYLRCINNQKESQKKLENINKKLREEIQEKEVIRQELFKAKNSFQNIVGKIEAGILIVDNQGIIKFVNPAAEQIFRRRTKDLIGESFGLLAEEEKKYELKITRKSGEVGIGEVTTTKTIWNGEPACLILINDITEHKRLEENLKKAKEQALESDRLKTAFLSNMSHEIRTPMNGIMGFVEILFDNDEDIQRKRNEYLTIIKNCGEHLLSLINDIVDLSKIEAGQLVLQEEKCNLNDLLSEVYDLFSEHLKVQTGKVQILKEVPQNSDDFIIKTDKHRFKQIFINLIGNSLKFTHNGFIKFGYSFEYNNIIKFTVVDSGVGIPDDKLDYVFERFTQINNDTQSVESGTGLGLAITKSLVELLNGTIGVSSRLNSGTVFTIKFEHENYCLINSKIDDVDLTKKAFYEIEYANKTILIAEDTELNYLLLENFLRAKKANILWAKNGQEAVEMCKGHNVDIVLMDIKMPLMDGLQATNEIRKFKKDLPIIAQTAYAIVGEKEMCLDAGCNDYIAKPIDPESFFNVIEKFFA